MKKGATEYLRVLTVSIPDRWGVPAAAGILTGIVVVIDMGNIIEEEDDDDNDCDVIASNWGRNFFKSIISFRLNEPSVSECDVSYTTNGLVAVAAAVSLIRQVVSHAKPPTLTSTFFLLAVVEFTFTHFTFR